MNLWELSCKMINLKIPMVHQFLANKGQHKNRKQKGDPWRKKAMNSPRITSTRLLKSIAIRNTETTGRSESIRDSIKIRLQ